MKSTGITRMKRGGWWWWWAAHGENHHSVPGQKRGYGVPVSAPALPKALILEALSKERLLMAPSACCAFSAVARFNFLTTAAPRHAAKTDIITCALAYVLDAWERLRDYNYRICVPLQAPSSPSWALRAAFLAARFLMAHSAYFVISALE